jgi:hypothetical protein
MMERSFLRACPLPAQSTPAYGGVAGNLDAGGILNSVPASQTAVLTPLAETLSRLQVCRSTPPRSPKWRASVCPTKQRAQQRPFQLLLGHSDTVWPPDTPGKAFVIGEE